MRSEADAHGHFGAYGGRYVPETLVAALDALEEPEGHFITEGAIAKYLATEAGNRAADAAI